MGNMRLSFIDSDLLYGSTLQGIFDCILSYTCKEQWILHTGHSLTWAQKRILLSQIFKVVESNFDQGCLTELTFIFLNIYTAVVDT